LAVLVVLVVAVVVQVLDGTMLLATVALVVLALY
jgi:hypothetical protein